MDRGWIKLWRKILSSEVFQNPNILKMFIWGLMKATHKEVMIPLKIGKGIEIVHLKPGQFIFGRNQSAKELKQPPSSARNWLHFLGNTQIWDIQKGQHYSVVTIRNWETYQGEHEKVGQPKRTTKGQPMDTNKNVKNNKKIYSQQSAEEIYESYPKKADKNNSIKSIRKLLESGETKETLMKAIDNYNAFIQRRKIDADFIIQSNNFFGRTARYKEYSEPSTQEQRMGENRIGRAIEKCKARGDY